jgi:Fe(II)/alpha-ketoglutarate-dependent arginine beta-hydroxylase
VTATHTRPWVAEYELCADEIETVDALVEANPALTSLPTDDPDWLFECLAVAQGLPEGLRRRLLSFRVREDAAVLVVRGCPVDDERIGRTPDSWQHSDEGARTRRELAWLGLVTALVGDAVAWATKQDGRVVHDIVPVRGHEDEQLGSGSRTALTWHTEDGFHPLRADYLALMCLRNHDAAGTTVAVPAPDDLPDDVAAVLTEPRFRLLPDGSHFQGVGQRVRDLLGDDVLARGRARIESLRDEPPARPVFYGAPEAPYVAVDQHFAEPVPGDALAADALRLAQEQISRTLQPVVLGPGDIVVLDNHRAVHGREAFTPRFDGTDRWFKRMNLTRDLRQSRAYRSTSDGRVIA